MLHQFRIEISVALSTCTLLEYDNKAIFTSADVGDVTSVLKKPQETVSISCRGTGSDFSQYGMQ